MVATFPKHICSKDGRMSVVMANARRYRARRKKLKSAMLDELTEVLHYNRRYLALLLRASGRSVFTHHRTRVVADPRVSLVSCRGRKKTYTADLLPHLKTVWRLADGISSVHLAAFIKANRAIIFRHRELKDIPPRLKQQLLAISPATIDRLLGPVRDRDILKQRYQRKPHAAWLRKAVPVQSYHDKPLDRFGYVEVDTVQHSGNTGRGQFCVTVTATEADTGWTELRALPNRAQVWVSKAMKRILAGLPFTPTEMHTDNGGEFINRTLIRTASRRKLKQTRSRAYHKNDAPYVESKNGSLVRAYVGYRRYETRPEYLILRQLAPLISLRHNLFMPTMKFQAPAQTDKSSARRRRTIATPYHRLLESKRLSPHQRRRLRALRCGADYFTLTERIAVLQRRLDRAYQTKYPAAPTP
jgi:hypothetical protein